MEMVSTGAGCLGNSRRYFLSSRAGGLTSCRADWGSKREATRRHPVNSFLLTKQKLGHLLMAVPSGQIVSWLESPCTLTAWWRSLENIRTSQPHGLNCKLFPLQWGFPAGSDSKESTCNSGDLGLIPGSGRPPGVGHGNPLQYSCLGNSMDRGAQWATVHRIIKSQPQLSD